MTIQKVQAFQSLNRKRLVSLMLDMGASTAKITEREKTEVRQMLQEHYQTMGGNGFPYTMELLIKDEVYFHDVLNAIFKDQEEIFAADLDFDNGISSPIV